MARGVVGVVGVMEEVEWWIGKEVGGLREVRVDEDVS